MNATHSHIHKFPPSPWLFRRLGAPLVAGLTVLIARTLQFRVEGLEHYHSSLRSGHPIIYAFWHEDLIGIAMAFLRLRPGPAAVMVSRSRDGEMLAQVIRRIGLQPVRASSTRGALAGFLEMKHWLAAEPGARAALALDGPRGPRRVAKPGVALLARRAEALVIPVSFDYGRAKRFGSWDRTALPYPFSPMTLHLAEPIDAAGTDDDADLLRRIIEKLKK